MRRNDKGLSDTQLHAIKVMGRRQLAGFPETRFRMTQQATYAEHPDCGGGTKLFVNRTTAASLYEIGLANINEAEDRVWLTRTAIALLRAGDEMRRM